MTADRKVLFTLDFLALSQLVGYSSVKIDFATSNSCAYGAPVPMRMKFLTRAKTAGHLAATAASER